jgi:hypothetical protein
MRLLDDEEGLDELLLEDLDDLGLDMVLFWLYRVRDEGTVIAAEVNRGEG